MTAATSRNSLDPGSGTPVQDFPDLLHEGFTLSRLRCATLEIRVAKSVGTILSAKLDIDGGRLLAYDVATEHKVRLGSIQRRGLLALLAYEALERPDDGWMDDAEVLARAPGWGPQKPATVGKSIHSLCEHPVLTKLIQSQGERTVGPWRLALPPKGLEVDVEALRSFLATRPANPKRHLSLKEPSRRRLRKKVRRANRKSEAQSLAELELWVERGILAPLAADTLKTLMTSEEELVRARAKRVEALRLRRLGKLDAARRTIRRAIVLLEAREPSPAMDLAAAKDEAAAIAYHQGQMGDAIALLREEISILNTLPDRTARARGLARANRWLAFVHLRLHAPESAKRAASAARDQARAASDDAERTWAELADLRVRIHTGDADRAKSALIQVIVEAPASHPVLQLMARRFYAEALFVAGLKVEGDQTAMGVFHAARALGLAREADAARNLLKHWRREPYLSLSIGDVSAKRDKLDELSRLWAKQSADGRLASQS